MCYVCVGVGWASRPSITMFSALQVKLRSRLCCNHLWGSGSSSRFIQAVGRRHFMVKDWGPTSLLAAGRGVPSCPRGVALQPTVSCGGLLCRGQHADPSDTTHSSVVLHWWVRPTEDNLPFDWLRASHSQPSHSSEILPFLMVPLPLQGGAQCRAGITGASWRSA